MFIEYSSSFILKNTYLHLHTTDHGDGDGDGDEMVIGTGMIDDPTNYLLLTLPLYNLLYTQLFLRLHTNSKHDPEMDRRTPVTQTVNWNPNREL